MLIYIIELSAYILCLCLLVVVLLLSASVRTRSRERSFDPRDAIIITGCDSGIGLELARHFANKYEFKVICGFLGFGRSPGFRELYELSSRKSQLLLQKLDVRSDQDAKDLVVRLSKLQNSGDVRHVKALINNAGVLAYGEFDWLTWDQITSQVEVNILGTIRITRSLLANIIASNGRIINVTSVCDNVLLPGLAVYAASKSAVSAFSDGLAYEMNKFGVKVIKVKLGDFAKLTNIMAKHDNNQREMWNDMDERKRSLYEGYFQHFNKIAVENCGGSGPSAFEDSDLIEDFELAIFSKNPPRSITIAATRYKILYSVFSKMPRNLNHWLLDTGLRLGAGLKWSHKGDQTNPH